MSEDKVVDKKSEGENTESDEGSVNEEQCPVKELTREDYIEMINSHSDCPELAEAIIGLSKFHNVDDVKLIAVGFGRLCRTATARFNLRTTRIMASTRHSLLKAFAADESFFKAACEFAVQAAKLSDDAQRVRVAAFCALVYEHKKDVEAAVSAFVALVLDPATSVAVPTQCVAQWSFVLNELAPELFTSKVLPSLNRAMKRLPQSGMTLAQNVLSAVHTVNSKVVEAVGSVISEVIRGAEATCGVAKDLVHSLLEGVKPELIKEACDTLMKRLWKIASGGDGVVAMVYQRTAAFEAIDAVALVVTGDSVVVEAATADNAITQLIGFEKKENNESVRLRIVQTLGHWLRASQTLPKSAADMLVASRLLDKEPFGSCACRALCEAASSASEAAKAQLSSVQTSLLKIAASESGKTPIRASPVLVEAVRGVLLIAKKTNPDSAKQLWDNALNNKSVLFAQEYINSLPPEAGKSLVDIVICASELKEYTSTSDVASYNLFNLLATALSSSLFEVRKYAADACLKSVQNKNIRTQLLHTCARRVHLLPALKVVKHQAPAPAASSSASKGGKGGNRGGKKAPAAAAVPASVAAAASEKHEDDNLAPLPCHVECVFACAGKDMTPEEFALYTVLCQHPSVSKDYYEGMCLWLRGVRRASGITEKDMPSTQIARDMFADNSTAVVEFLLSSNVLQSSEEANGLAGVQACRAIASVCKTEFDSINVEKVLESILKALRNSVKVMDTLSDYEKSVFAADDITVVPEPAAATPAEEETGKNKGPVKREKKQRGESRMYKVEDELWDKKVRQEMDEKKSAEREAERRKMEKELLVKQKALRATLTMKLNPVRMLCRGFNVIIKNRRESGESLLPSVLPEFINLLNSIPLMKDEVSSIIMTLCSCVPSVMPLQYAQGCAHAITFIYSQGSVDEPTLPSSAFEPVTHIVFAMSERPLPLAPSIIAVLIPLVKPCLRAQQDQTTQRAQAASVKLLCAHTQPIFAYPRRDMAALFALIISDYPRFIARATTALSELAAGMKLSDISPVVEGMLHPMEAVRSGCLSAMLEMPFFKEAIEEEDQEKYKDLLHMLSLNLSLERNDEVASVASLAAKVTEYTGRKLNKDEYYSVLEPFMMVPDADLRNRAVLAVAHTAGEFPETAHATLTALLDLYKKNPYRSLIVTEDIEESERIRERRTNTCVSIMKCIGECGCAYVDFAEDTSRALAFLLWEPLKDQEEVICDAAIVASSRLVELQGAKFNSEIYAQLQEFLAKSKGKEGDVKTRASLKQSVIVCLGTLMRFSYDVPCANERALEVIEQMRGLVRSKSKVLQQAIGDGYAATARMLKEDDQKTECERLMDMLLTHNNEDEQRGAAFCLGGLVKGLGLSVLKKLDIVTRLSHEIDNKKNAVGRRGAILGYHYMCLRLGRLFEPYIIQILPKLLAGYGDSDSSVRTATQAAGRQIMNQLSSHGMKLVLPALIKATSDESWRTKKNSIEILGSLAFCAPQQLSSYLPEIVPSLLASVIDSQPEVQSTAKDAIKNIASVIHNPEILTVLELLVRALCDPSEHTKQALDILQTISFVHRVDAASLSLMMPVLSRALLERSSESKRNAVHIIGNMCSLADPNDVIPYMPRLIPLMERTLVDPSPDVRAETARALGSLTAGIGEKHFRGLIDWMLQTMRSDKGPVERSGAAQGLSEVLAGFKPDELERTLPGLLEGVHDESPDVREGTLALFRYLAVSIGDVFARYVKQAYTGVFDCVMDEHDSLRDAAFRAGAAITSAYWTTQLERIAPLIEEAMFHDNWHVQDAAVSYVSDIANKVLAKNQSAATAREPARVFINTLGAPVAKSLLVHVFTLRFDDTTVISQKAVVVWKTLVANPPRLLQEIMPEFLDFLVTSLSSSSHHLQTVASAALGDLVTRLAATILPIVVPTLEKQLDHRDSHVRRGVCLGLANVVHSSEARVIGKYIDTLIPSVRTACCDSSQEVRVSAHKLLTELCETFDAKTIIDRCLNPLINDLKNSEKRDQAMMGIVQIALAKSRMALRSLVPVFAHVPMTEFDAVSLAAVAANSNNCIGDHLSTIISCAVETVVERPESKDYISKCLCDIAATLSSSNINTLVEQYRAIIINKKTENSIKVETLSQLTVFLKNTTATVDKISGLEDLFNDLLSFYISSDENLLSHSRDALKTLVDRLKKEGYPRFVAPIRKSLQELESELPEEPAEAHVLPGFVQPHGPDALIPIFMQSLLTVSAAPESSSDILDDDDDDSGSPMLSPHVIREQAASGLGDIIRLMTEDSLKPYFVPMIGPLIRVVGERFASPVKAAILRTLTLLLKKGSAKAKPFLPQLQMSFVKSLRDSGKIVRQLAVEALGTLVKIGARIDQLLNELMNSFESGDLETKEIMLAAIGTVMSNTVNVPTRPVLERIPGVVMDNMKSADDVQRGHAANSLAFMMKFLGTDAAVEFASSSPLFQVGAVKTSFVRRGRDQIIGLLSVNAEPIARALADKEFGVLKEDMVQSPDSNMRNTAIWAFGRLAGLEDLEAPEECYVLLGNALKDNNVDVCMASMKALRHIMKANTTIVAPHAELFRNNMEARNAAAPQFVKLSIAATMPYVKNL